MQRWISGDQGTFRPCHLLASAHPKTHQTQRLGQVLASRLIAAPTDAWFLGSSVFELGLIELSWVLTVLIHHIQRNSGRFSGILWHFHDPNLTSQNFTAWRAASKALRCRGSPRGAAPRSCCSARRMGRSFDLRFRRDADVSRLLAANYTNTFNHLYIYINILDLPKFNNFRTLGIVGSKSGQKGANGTNCANWIKRSEIVWNIMQHDKHAGWWWNMMKPPKPYTIKSKWLGAYSSPKHIQSNITKHPLWGHPLPKVRPAPLLCALFFLHAVARFGDALPSTSVCDGLIWFKGSAMVVIEGCWKCT